MIKNPIHLRLEKLSHRQLLLFMLCLCERMYPNFAFYCQQVDNSDHKTYKNMLNLIWELLIVKNAHIDFDKQLEKLEWLIPVVDEQSPYSIYPAIDACQALSELMHAYLSNEYVEYAISISQLSLKTIVELEQIQTNTTLSEEQLKTLPPILDELDIQWEIYRLIKKDQIDTKLDALKTLKNEFREEQISNIGVFLSD